MRWKRSLLTLSVMLTILALNGSTLRGTAPASIHISPWGYAFPPVDITVTMHIEKDSKNISASLLIAGPDYYSDSDFPLDGPAIFFTRTIRDLRLPGTYQAFLQIHRANGDVKQFKSETLQLKDEF